MKDQEREITERLARLIALVEPSREEILERHGPAIDAWVRSCMEDQKAPAPGLIELFRGWWVKLAEGTREFQAGLNALASAVPLATRGATKGVELSPTPAAEAEAVRHLVSMGAGCSGHLWLRRQADGRLTIQVGLRDGQGEPIRPFLLTVRQQDAVLLNAKRIDGDLYEVPNISIGAYQLELVELSGSRRVELGWSPA